MHSHRRRHRCGRPLPRCREPDGGRARRSRYPRQQRRVSEAEGFDDIDIEDWERTFQVNINGMFYITKFAVPHMKDGGAIVNTSSINAKQPTASLLSYSATKAAIANLTLGLAQLLAEEKIRVNAVLPGRSGLRSSPPACIPDKSKISAGRRRSSGRVSPPSSLPPTSCSPRTTQATRRAPSSSSRAACRSSECRRRARAMNRQPECLERGPIPQ